MIEVDALTKRYGSTTAVDGLTFAAQPGMVTGFLGPNGAGKSTTMRVVVGLERPTSGTATVDGRRFADLPAPLHEVGRHARRPLRAPGPHGVQAPAGDGADARHRQGPGAATSWRRPAWSRRRTAARARSPSAWASGSASRGRCSAIPRRSSSTSRSTAWTPTACCGCGTWCASWPAQGRTVLLSSHLMHELALCADRVVIIGRGRLLADASVQEIVDRSERAGTVRVRTTDPEPLARALVAAGAQVTPQEGGVLQVRGASVDDVGAAARRCGVTVLELGTESGSLEEAYLQLTGDAVEYRGRCAMSTTFLRRSTVSRVDQAHLAALPVVGRRRDGGGGRVPHLPERAGVLGRPRVRAARLADHRPGAGPDRAAGARGPGRCGGVPHGRVPDDVHHRPAPVDGARRADRRRGWPSRWASACWWRSASVLGILPAAASRGIAVDLGADDTPGVLVGTVLLVVGLALFGLAVGMLLRRTVPALVTALFLVLILPVVLMPGDRPPGGRRATRRRWRPPRPGRRRSPAPLGALLPGNAGQLMTMPASSGPMDGAPDLGPVGGGLVLAAWIVVLLVAVAVRLRVRDVR